jgi:hypothetical protein
MVAKNPKPIVEEDPLEGGSLEFWIAGIFLLPAAAAFLWSSQFTYAELHDTPVLPIAGFATLVGVSSLVFGLWLEFRLRKFGHSFLKTEKPIAGQPWKGAIRTTFELSVKGNYIFTLTYEETHYSSFEKKNVTVVVWKATCETDYRSVRSSAGIPFKFAPPGSELKKSKSGGMWWLKVTAPMRGLNYMTLFNVTFLLDAPPKGEDMPW